MLLLMMGAHYAMLWVCPQSRPVLVRGASETAGVCQEPLHERDSVAEQPFAERDVVDL